MQQATFERFSCKRIVRRHLIDPVGSHIVAAELSLHARWAVDILDHDEITRFKRDLVTVDIFSEVASMMTRRVLVKHRRMLKLDAVLPEGLGFLPCLVKAVGGAQAREHLHSDERNRMERDAGAEVHASLA